MFRLFSSPLEHEKPFSRILYYCDLGTLDQVRMVNRSWNRAVSNMMTRKRIFESTLAKCDFFSTVCFAGFDFEKLSGGLTNTTFKLTIARQLYVARLPGKKTDLYLSRAAEYHNATTATECAINADIVYYDPSKGSQVTVFLKQPDSMDATKIKEEANLSAAIKTLLTIHQSGKKFANDVDVFERNEKMLAIIAEKPSETVEIYKQLAATMEKIKNIVALLNLPRVPCHNDTTPTNFILSANKMYLIDWEYSGNNYRIWDLVCLAMEAHFPQEKIEQMLKLYYGIPDNESQLLFRVLMPVYEYWVALWAGVQIANGNVVENIEEIQALEQTRLKGCQTTLASESFKSALAALESLALNKVPAATNTSSFDTGMTVFSQMNSVTSTQTDTRPYHAPRQY